MIRCQCFQRASCQLPESRFLDEDTRAVDPELAMLDPKARVRWDMGGESRNHGDLGTSGGIEVSGDDTEAGGDEQRDREDAGLQAGMDL